MVARLARPCIAGRLAKRSLMWAQRAVTLRPRPRGIHLVSGELLDGWAELAHCRVGLLHVFLQHSSAGLILNENADPTVRSDLADWFDRVAPDGDPAYAHDCEGPDDMPAHIKAVLTGCSMSIPVADGHVQLGTWQGIHLCEFRDRGGPRRVVLTLHGQDA